MSQSVTTPPPDMAAYVTRDELRVDLAELRLEFRTEIAGLRAEIGQLRMSVTSDIATLCVELTTGQTAQLRWLVGTILAAAALVVAALKLLPPL